MAGRGGIKFYFLGGVPRNERNLKGILLNARNMALQLDPSIKKVLIKGGAHESSTKTGTGELLKFPLHYTYHFKNDALDKANKHYSAHADVILDQTTKAPKNWYLTNLSPRYEADGKTLHEDPDEYQDLKKGKKWNKWDMTLNQITEFNEDAIADWYIGDNFLTYPLKGKKPTGSEQPKDQPSEKELADLKADQVKSKNDTEAAILKDAK